MAMTNKNAIRWLAGLAMYSLGMAMAGEYRVMAIPSERIPNPAPTNVSQLAVSGTANNAATTSDVVVFAALPSDYSASNHFVSTKTETIYVYDVTTGYIIPNSNVTLTPPKPRPFSGGHDHNDTSRPAGSLSPLSGNTGANGFQFQTTFTAPEVSGIVDTYGNCTAPGGFTCFPNYDVPIGVEVPYFFELAPGSTYDLVGSYGMPGVNSQHTRNHFGTYSFTSKLLDLAALYYMQYQNQPNPKLQFNDMSLEKGGLFDIYNNWHPDHFEHRVGISADLSLVAPARRRNLPLLLRKAGIVGLVKVHANHWHIREYGATQ